MKELDEKLPPQLAEILDKGSAQQTRRNSLQEKVAVIVDASPRNQNSSVALDKLQEVANLQHLEVKSVDGGNQSAKQKSQNGQFGAQSMEMIKVRAALEEKLRQKGISTSAYKEGEKSRKQSTPVNGMLETRDDFDDDASGHGGTKHGLTNGKASLSQSTKPHSLVTKQTKSKFISGDDDLPRRDDIGERRRKHELRVLTGAGVEPEDEAGSDDSPPQSDPGSDSQNSESGESGDEFYEQIKQQRAAKLVAK